jgi:hypothetical protein
MSAHWSRALTEASEDAIVDMGCFESAAGQSKQFKIHF